MPATGSRPKPRKPQPRPPPFADARVAQRFADYGDDVRSQLTAVREPIFEVAAETEAVGPLLETLKWNQPAYLPKTPRIGTTVRIDAVKGQPGSAAVYVHCQTSLIDTFRHLYRDRFQFEGNRAVIVSGHSQPQRAALKHCIALALTYHLDRKSRSGRS